MKKQSGFTLVELAIVLMIIGLLIGGVLRGQELMKNAQITSTIQQVKAYQGALHTFSDMYQTLPGDMPMANTRLAGCETGNANSCIPGNGDGIVGDLQAGQGTFANEPWQGISVQIADESVQFWKHLALAHLISGVDPSAGTPDWGKSQPKAKVAGGFFIRYTNFNVGGFIPWSGHILVIRRDLTDSSTADTIAPKYAAMFDRKMDDGMAAAGDMRSFSHGWSGGCGNAGWGNQGPNGYDETSDQLICITMFRI